MCSQGGRICCARVLPRVPALVNSSRGKALLPIYIWPLQRRTLGKMHGFSELPVEKSPLGGPWAPRKVHGSSTQFWAGKFGCASQTDARAMRNARCLISSIYFYCHLQSYSWYFTFIWESLCSLKTFTHPIRGEFFRAHFPDTECGWINVTVKPFPARFPCLSSDLTLITQPGLPGGADFHHNC